MGYCTSFVGKIRISPNVKVEDFVLPEIGTASPAFTSFPPNKFYQLTEEEKSNCANARSSCCWQLTTNRNITSITWNGIEKCYNSVEWMGDICDMLAKKGYKLNGRMSAYGDEKDDRWTLVVVNNTAFRLSKDILISHKDKKGRRTQWVDRNKKLNTYDQQALHDFMKYSVNTETIESLYELITDDVIARLFYCSTTNKDIRASLESKFGVSNFAKGHFFLGIDVHTYPPPKFV